MRETWKTIPGYEGHYEISDRGRVRSLDRTVPMEWHSGKKTSKFQKGKILSSYPDPEGHRTVNLKVRGFGKPRRIKDLMALVHGGSNATT